MNDDYQHRPHDHLVEPLFGGLHRAQREGDDRDPRGDGERESSGWWTRPWGWALGLWRRSDVSSS